MKQSIKDNYSLASYQIEKELLLENFLHKSEQIIQHYRDNFNPYPMEVNEEFVQQAVLLQSVIIKSVEMIVNNYFQDKDVQLTIKLSDHQKELLQIASEREYMIGTIRPDFIFDINQTIKICEINARFCLNGFVLSNYLADYFCKRALKPSYNFHYFGQNIISTIGSFFIRDKPIRIIKASEKGYDIHLINYELKKEPYRMNIEIISPEMLTFNKGKIYANDIDCDQFILELHQHELLSLPTSILHHLIKETTYINDIRTILIAHDKRLLSVLCNPEIMSRYISLEEVKLLQKHIIFTMPINEKNTAYINYNPDLWVIKKSFSGKGDGVYFGKDTARELLSSILSETTDFYIAQHYIKQKKIEIFSIRERESIQLAEKYLVGMIMSFNHTVFGIGFFRAGSESIVNVFSGGEIIASQCS